MAVKFESKGPLESDSESTLARFRVRIRTEREQTSGVKMQEGPQLGEVQTLRIECCDCGRERWWKEWHLARYHVAPSTPLQAFARRLRCRDCQDQGLVGDSISVVAEFKDGRAAERAEIWARSPAARSTVSRAS